MGMNMLFNVAIKTWIINIWILEKESLPLEWWFEFSRDCIFFIVKEQLLWRSWLAGDGCWLAGAEASWRYSWRCGCCKHFTLLCKQSKTKIADSEVQFRSVNIKTSALGEDSLVLCWIFGPKSLREWKSFSYLWCDISVELLSETHQVHNRLISLRFVAASISV